MALRHPLSSVALIGLMAQPALAQSQDTQRQQPAAQAGQHQLAPADIEFAKKAAEGSVKELQFGKLAQEQAASAAINQFGRLMVQDHTRANDQLKQIAQSKSIELPQEMTDDAQQKYDELEQKSGPGFDQSYMDAMVSDHETEIARFQSYVERGQDPDLTSFAQQSLPILEEHLQFAQQTQEQLTASAGQVVQQATAMPGEQPAGTQPQQPISLQDVLGSEVVNSAGKDVAEIEDLVLDQSGNYHAVLSVGGYLGIGEKQVAVPLDELQLGDDETYLMTAVTEEQLEQMPDYDPQQYRPYAARQ